MLPLSPALVVSAPATPKLPPEVSPRRIVRGRLLLMLVASMLLADSELSPAEQAEIVGRHRRRAAHGAAPGDGWS